MHSTFVYREEERLRYIPRDKTLLRISSTLEEDFLSSRSYDSSSRQVPIFTSISQKGRRSFNVPRSSIIQMRLSFQNGLPPVWYGILDTCSPFLRLGTPPRRTAYSIEHLLFTVSRPLLLPQFMDPSFI